MSYIRSGIIDIIVCYDDSLIEVVQIFEGLEFPLIGLLVKNGIGDLNKMGFAIFKRDEIYFLPLLSNTFNSYSL